MRELKERLTEVDRVEFPGELWSTALRRAAVNGDLEPITRSPLRPARRIAATTVAFAVFVAAAIFLWNAFDSRSQRPRPGETTPTPNPLSQLPAGWTELPDPPDVRAGSAAAWTGSELLVWGGYVYTGFSDEEALEDGYLLDPLTGSTETVPAAPLTARAFPAAAWTGSELIVWGGSDLRDGFFDDGAAYDPESGEWRALPQAPIEARRPFSAWTGSELLVWGSKWRDMRLVDGAAYDPAADSWRRIADAPLELTDGTAVWTGKEMIIFGAALHGGNQAESETAIGAAYDPAADSWRLLPDSQLSPQASTAAWNGQRMIAWDYLNQSQSYDPERDEWSPVERVPLQDFECSPQSVSVSESVLGEYCGQTTIHSDGGWSNISRRKYAGWGFALMAADPAVLLVGSNVDTGANVLLAYRVESDVGTTTTATTEPLPPGSLMFTREEPEGGGWRCDLFTVGPDDSGERALTDTPSTCEALPAVAPGGSRVAVSLDLHDIAVIDLATSTLRRLTDDPATLDNHPAWSPDGSQIVFSRGPEMGPSHIYVMNADGADVRQLTQGSGSDRNPSWSPDGTRIAFARNGEVYVMDADGSNVEAVTAVSAESAPSPAWSPDGSQIALDVDGAIYVISVDGTGLRRFSPELPKGVLDQHPSWSPDGTQIAFMRYTNEDVAAIAEDGDIWIIEADGTDATRVTHGPAIDSWPQWVSGSA